MAADLQRVSGDARLLGITKIAASVNEGTYDDLSIHFERRFSANASFQTNYTLAWARGMGGSLDGALRVASPAPWFPSATGGDIYAPWEYGPSVYDERHRVTIAGVFNLPFGFDVSPSVTAATARPYNQYRTNTGDLQPADRLSGRHRRRINHSQLCSRSRSGRGSRSNVGLRPTPRLSTCS